VSPTTGRYSPLRGSDFERQHFDLLALMCTYGIELLADNITECRANMLEILADYLNLKESEDIYRAASYVLSQSDRLSSHGFRGCCAFCGRGDRYRWRRHPRPSICRRENRRLSSPLCLPSSCPVGPMCDPRSSTSKSRRHGFAPFQNFSKAARSFHKSVPSYRWERFAGA
jgi:hypothetical protein